jgi:hypothetical protein
MMSILKNKLGAGLVALALSSVALLTAGPAMAGGGRHGGGWGHGHGWGHHHHWGPRWGFGYAGYYGGYYGGCYLKKFITYDGDFVFKKVCY